MRFVIFFSLPQRNAGNDAWEVVGTLKQVHADGTRTTVLWAEIPLGEGIDPKDFSRFQVAYAQDLKDLVKAAIQAAEIAE